MSLTIFFILILGTFSVDEKNEAKSKRTLNPASLRKENSFGSGATIMRTAGTRPRPIYRPPQIQAQEIKPANKKPEQIAEIKAKQSDEARLVTIKEEDEKAEARISTNTKLIHNEKIVEDYEPATIKANKGADEKIRSMVEIDNNMNAVRAKMHKLVAEIEHSEMLTYASTLNDKVLADKIRNNIEVSLKNIQTGCTSEASETEDLDFDFVFEGVEVPSLFDTSALFNDSFFANSRPMIRNDDIVIKIGEKRRLQRRVLVMEMMHARNCLNTDQQDIFRNMMKSQRFSNAN